MKIGLGLKGAASVLRRKALPFICCDIDGVLKLGHDSIPTATETVKRIKDLGIPFLLVTNSGGDIESARAQYISKILKIDKDELYKFKENEILLCHSPMRRLVEKYKNKTLLVMGIKRYEDVIKAYGFTNYITVHEYAHIFHKKILAHKTTILEPFEDEKTNLREVVERRLGISLKYKLPQINAIVDFTDIRHMYEAIQVHQLLVDRLAWIF